MQKAKIGIWLIGAKGGVAATTLLGLAALKNKLTGPIGLVSELPLFSKLNLPVWDDFVVGGHEIRRSPLLTEVEKLASESHTVPPAWIDACREEIEAIDRRIRPGTNYRVGDTINELVDVELPQEKTPREIVARLQSDLRRFAESEKLEQVIVVNVASTEPAVNANTLPTTWAECEPLLNNKDCPLPASTLYAVAALEAGCSYLNFTPSLGSAPAALDDLACRCKSRHYGCDGKTGETLMKSVLAPLFARRNLNVQSWVGHNIFGNMDGRILNDPVNKETKVASKDHLVREILGYRPHSVVSIEYVPDLGDWKTAWDHIHFQAFLGVPMTLQFTWQGCDSILAAPLVLDLVRFTALAARRGEIGQMPFLASFFKSPYAVAEQNFERQFQMLEAWASQQET